MSYSVMTLGDDYSIALASSDEQEYTSVYAMDNTVSPNGVSVSAYYYNTDGKLVQGPEVSAYQTAGSTGYLRMLLNQANLKIPDDFAYMSHYAIKLSSISFPDPGVYEMCFGIGVSELSGLTCSMQLGTRKYIGNAKYQDSHDELDVYSTSGGMFCYPTTVDIGNISYMELRVYPTNWKTYYFPTRLIISFVFEKQSSDTAADITTAGGSYSSADAATDTAQNTSQIVQNTSEMNDTLKEIVQTISNQLEALWDQMYNLMHVPQLANDNKNTDRIVNKQQEQIENDNANTEAVTGAIERHGNFIIEGLKSLFIPSDEYFKSWFDGMYAFFNDRLGFLMLPVDVLIEFIDIFSASSEEFAGIPFPEFKWVDGTVVIPAQTVKFDFLETDWGKDIQTKMYFVGNVIMIGSLFHLIQQKLKEVTEQ